MFLPSILSFSKGGQVRAHSVLSLEEQVQILITCQKMRKCPGLFSLVYNANMCLFCRTLSRPLRRHF